MTNPLRSSSFGGAGRPRVLIIGRRLRRLSLCSRARPASRADLRERILRQLEVASATTDVHARELRGSFVVVGGGFTGLELAAQGLRLSRAALRQHAALDAESVRWTVLEAAPSVLGQFPARLARRALDRIRERGVDVRLGAAVAEVAPEHVRLANGETIQAQTVVWTTGVTPAPLISELGLPLQRGRLIVGDHLQTRDHSDVFALGDAAAVPDLPTQASSQPRLPSTRNGRA